MNSHEIAQVWDALGQMYGSRFYEQYGESANEAWLAALTSMTLGAALYAIRALVRDGSDFPPTLPKFSALASQYRPRESIALPAAAHNDADSRTTAELRAAASSDVSAFGTYREYEKWRDANTKGGKRPNHPEPHSADWEYLRRLAWIQAAANNRRTVAGLDAAA